MLAIQHELLAKDACGVEIESHLPKDLVRFFKCPLHLLFIRYVARDKLRVLSAQFVYILSPCFFIDINKDNFTALRNEMSRSS